MKNESQLVFTFFSRIIYQIIFIFILISLLGKAERRRSLSAMDSKKIIKFPNSLPNSISSDSTSDLPSTEVSSEDYPRYDSIAIEC
jgi:hypothetical protein